MRADVVHAHNLHPLFGWRALAAARAAGARTVLHLHNFRLFCAIGVAYRDGAPCYDCQRRNTLPGVIHRCRGSLAEAAVYAVGLHRQQPRLFEHADEIVVMRRRSRPGSRPLGLEHRRPNCPAELHRRRAMVRSAARPRCDALVAGRLVPEKGFDTAIAAAARAEIPLLIAGTGPTSSACAR